MLQALYIIAFIVLASLAIGNLVRNLFTLGIDSQRGYGHRSSQFSAQGRSPQPSPHPELLDNDGQVIDEPLLVMKSISVDDARERLDALYLSSPESSDEAQT
jgi:Protein of unknown function (DUF2973)